MATNVDEKIDIHVDTECTAPPTVGQSDTADTGCGQRCSSCRTRLLTLGRLLLHLVCLGYSLYLIWLLVYLKGNNYYWFLGFIPFIFNFVPFTSFLTNAYDDNDFFDIEIDTVKIYVPSVGVVINVMTCFTMLTRQAYYHRQPDEFIGPRFIILSLQASIILILLNFFLRKGGKVDSLLDNKDALTRVLLDFVDIFNMVEILSVNDCVGVGSFVSEESSTERAIQAFCTMSFGIVLTGTIPYEVGMDVSTLPVGEENHQRSPRTRGEPLHFKTMFVSGLYQNLPFLVIRIVVWARFRLYSLGFLVKNVIVIIFWIAMLYRGDLKSL